MARTKDTPCAGGCGELLWGGRGALPAGERTCRACRTAARVARDALKPTWESRLRAITTCPVCGVEFRPRHTPQRACSRECGFELQRRDRFRGQSTPICWAECEACGRTIVGNKRRKCQPCALIRVGYVKRTGKELATTCAKCGEAFTFTVVIGRHPKRCAACKVADEKRWSRDVRNAARRRKRANGEDHRGFRKRAAKYGVAYEPVNRRKVYERDSWTCGICGEQLDRDAKVPDPWAPTLDHIRAMANGGPHTYANVQAAHFWCNSVKGDRDDYAWMGPSGGGVEPRANSAHHLAVDLSLRGSHKATDGCEKMHGAA